MQRQGYRLNFTNMDESTWRAKFSSAPLLAEDGFGAESTPWRAVEVAAWEALSTGRGPAAPDPDGGSRGEERAGDMKA
jgi:hypothetical protein